MLKHYAVTYELAYVHRVMVGIRAINEAAAVKIAQEAFGQGVIWDDTQDMPLLFDDYEEEDGQTLSFTAEEITVFPKADASVEMIRRQELAFSACRLLQAGDIESALSLVNALT